MDNLTPQLSVEQIKQNIDALKRQGKDSRSIQSYVDNYKRDTSGNFVLKTSQSTEQPKSFTQKAMDVGTKVTDFLGGKAVADTLGSELAKIGKTQQEKDIISAEQPTLKETAGSALQLGSLFVPVGEVAKGAQLGAKALGLSEGVAKVAGNVLAGGATGGAFDVGEKLQTGETSGAATAIGAAIPLVSPVTSMVGRAVSKTGSKIAELVIPVGAREANMIQSYRANKPFMERVSDVLMGTEKAPQTVGKTAVQTTAGQTLPGLFGTKTQIGVQARRASKSLWQDLVKPALENAKVNVNLNEFFNQAERKIIASNPELGRQGALLEALQAVKDDYKNVNQISLEDLQNFKEGWAKFVPDKAYNGKPISASYNDVRNTLSNEARNTIYSVLGDDIKQAYFDYGNLVGLQEIGKKALTGEKLKGGAGSFIYDIFNSAVTPVATIGGQVIYRTGKGIEFIGKAGAKILGEALDVAPGDKALQGIKQDIKETQSIPNKQGGFIKNPLGNANPTVGKTVGSLESFGKYKGVEDFVKTKTGANIETGNSYDETLGRSIDFKIGDANVRTNIRETPNEIYLNTIGTRKLSNKLEELFGSGKGTEVINIMKEYADLTGKKLIVPDATNKALPFWKKFTWLEEDYGVKIPLDGKQYNPPNTFSYSPKTVGKTVDSTLIEEAKKYKSAEEFVNAQPKNKLGYINLDKSYNLPLLNNTNDTVKVYRGGGRGELRLGDFVSTNKTRASQYGNIQEFDIPKNQLRLSDPQARKLKLHTKNDLIYDNRTQLTDIWNKANKKTAK